MKPKLFKRSCLVLGLLLFFISSQSLEAQKVKRKDLKKDVELVTDFGSIVIRLSDKTPAHRNNFIKLVKGHYYDRVIFHRVINDFLIQTGGHRTAADSLTTKLSITIPDTVKAEINTALFHHRGALNAARMGDDDNPTQASSGTQFTIIQGGPKTADELDIAEGRINNWLAYNRVVQDPANQDLFRKYISARNENSNEFTQLKSRLQELTDMELKSMSKYKIPEAHRAVYESTGGAPHLDQNYVVFGHVMKGMDVVDQIAKVETGRRGMPNQQVKILTARLIKRVDY